MAGPRTKKKKERQLGYENSNVETGSRLLRKTESARENIRKKLIQTEGGKPAVIRIRQ